MRESRSASRLGGRDGAPPRFRVLELAGLKGLPLRRATTIHEEARGLCDEASADLLDRLFLAPKTVEAHIASIYSKLELLPAPDDHRRVLAVLAHLRG